jgi:hypothetical protein
MNRALRKQSMKRCAFRAKRGGGFSAGPALLPVPVNDWTYAQKQLINNPYSDCGIPSRTGQLFNQPNPDLAQVIMAGGKRRNGRRTRRRHGGVLPPPSANGTWGKWDPPMNPDLAQVAMAGGAWTYDQDLSLAQTPMAGGSWTYNQDLPLAQTPMAGGGNGCSAMRGGACGCSVPKAWSGGRRRRTYRKMRGGSYRAVDVFPGVSVGGDGPNVAPLHAGVPCDGRAGTPNQFNQQGLTVDVRAPADLYSVTTNQTPPSVQAGGAYSTGNGFSEGCYKAPGSMLPVYEAETAGFHFRPSTESGSTLPDGITAYNDVVPHAARLGGGRKNRKASRKNRKASRKNRKASRKNRKASRKNRNASRKNRKASRKNRNASRKN